LSRQWVRISFNLLEVRLCEKFPFSTNRGKKGKQNKNKKITSKAEQVKRTEKTFIFNVKQQ